MRHFLSTLLILALLPACRAQNIAQPVYTDSLQNGWQSYGWATLNYSNPAPTHSGSDSISVTAGAWQALYLHHNAQDSTSFGSLTFWINGGAAGGQRLQVEATLSGKGQAAVPVAPLKANTWQQVTIPLTALGVANSANFDGFWIQDVTGTAQPTFYVDDITLTAGTAAQPTSANLSVNAATVIRALDGRVYGLNTAIWDANLGATASVSLLATMQTQILRFPGGSASDAYDWSTDKSDGNTWRWASSQATLAALAEAAHAQTMITVNYGSGTPEMAAAWVAYANGAPANPAVIGTDARGRDWMTVGYWASLRAAAPLATDDGYNFLRVGRPAPYGYRYWEIGNECYGGWENDQHGAAGSWLTGAAHDAYTYATYAAAFYQKMKAADPTIKIGAVGIPGEDAWGDGKHAVANPNENNTLHSGWTPVLLATLQSLGITPDFLIHHRYPQNPGSESDAGLLQSSAGWASDAANLRKMLTDYAGTAGAGVELDATESNSVSSNPGKQSVSLVNGLFFADSVGQLAQTEFNADVWWDFRNGASGNYNNSASLYGWREFGDYGVVAGGDRSDTPVNTPYPTFYAAKLLTHWARGGDRIVSASSKYKLLSVYAARLAQGNLALLVINKNSASTLMGNITITGFRPAAGAAMVYQYGKPQDAVNGDLAQSTVSIPGAKFACKFPSYSMTVIILKPAK